MKYCIRIGKLPTLLLTQQDYENLREAITRHESLGYQSGETRFENCIITECGEPYPKPQASKDTSS